MSARVPQEWTDYGASFGRDGLLYLPEWRRGFTVHELRALFFECQQVRTLKTDLARVVAERDALAAQVDALEKKAAFYRRSLVLESRYGMMLEAITSS